MDKVEVFEIK